jgi:hypothetical protein
MNGLKPVSAAVASALLLLAVGCGQGDSRASEVKAKAAEPSRPPQTDRAAVQRAEQRPRRTPARRRARRTRTPRLAARGCPPAGRVLEGVYHPEWLEVLNGCKPLGGTVVLVRREEDGDRHFDVALDRRHRKVLLPGNFGQKRGALVVEFMARDGGHLPAPAVGDRVDLVGALVNDAQHNWAELHPVWAVRINGGRWSRSGPRFGGSPPQDRSYNAAGDCTTPSGGACRGYGGAPGGGAGPSRRPRREPAPSGRSGGRCEPGYSPCLPVTGDLNCSDIPADKRPVRVRGNDRYGLDRDGDGLGCED